MTPTKTVLSNDRLYNGKELQDGTNWLDYGARMYYPELGRWMAVDPLSEKNNGISGFSYVSNNPILFTDPLGLDTVRANNNNTPVHQNDVIKFDNGTTAIASMNEVTVTAQKEQNKDSKETKTKDEPNWLRHLLGPAVYSLVTPTPKRFVMRNSSGNSSILSETMSKLIKKPISLKNGTIRRLYTHTVNGYPRYAATWGRYLGRWGTRIAGPTGWGLTIYDIANTHLEMVESDDEYADLFNKQAMIGL